MKNQELEDKYKILSKEIDTLDEKKVKIEEELWSQKQEHKQTLEEN